MSFMKKRNPNRINELRLARRWSQSELAEKVGAHWVTVSKLERGQMRLTHEWMNRLAGALGVEPVELIADPPTKRTIYIHGVIDQNGLIDRGGEGTAGDDILAVPFTVEIGSPEPDRTVWYMVGSQSFYPFIQTGDVIRFTYQSNLEISQAVRKICLVETDENPSRKVVGILSRGSTPDRVDVQIMGGQPLIDLPVRDIAVASMAIFEPEFEIDDDGPTLP